MKKRSLYIICSLTSLMAGGMIYLLLSENTILENLLRRFNFYCETELFSAAQGSFFRNHLCDYLWAFALGCALWAIYLPKGIDAVLACSSVFGCGVFWELAQYCGIVSGTGDLLDIGVYLLAAITVPLLNLKRGKRK